VKLATFDIAGRVTYGALIDGGLSDLGARFAARFPDLKSALAADAVAELAAAARDGEPRYSLEAVSFLPPIPQARIFCVGRNYKAHVAESGGAPPAFPSVFLRLPSSVVGHGQPMRLSPLSTHYDYEGELAVVIGRGGRHIARERALDHVAGYACFNEACYRDYQFKHSLATGKNFAASGAFGPWLTTADETGDPRALTLTTRLNGVQVQHAPVSDLIFDIPFLVAYFSGITPLEPGDVISTGTPEGVGFARTTPLWLKAGDEVEVEIGSVGLLRNRVEREVAPVESSVRSAA